MNLLLAIRGRSSATEPRRSATRWLVATAAVLVLAATGCSPPNAADAASAGADADVTLVSRDMAFDQATITTSAGSAWTMQLVNEDSAPHNVAIYTDESAEESLFVGETISSATVVYDVPVLEPGTYFFRCDLHPEMNGTLVVEG